MPALLRIHLLGGFRLIQGDTVLHELEAPSLRSLVTYLLVHRALTLPRQQIAFALWPDTLETQAQANLRTLFVRLRRAWTQLDDYLELGPRTVQWRAGIPLQLDLAEFEASVERAAHAAARGGEGLQVELEAALRYYSGELLPGSYDDWLLAERERLRGKYLHALRQLIPVLEAAGDFDLALVYAQKWLQAEPLDEVIYQTLMRLHAARGDRAGVVQMFDTCQTVLKNELDTEPSTATQALFAQLARLSAPTAKTLARPRAAGGLARPLTRFVGRESSLTALRGLLGTSRLVSLTGTGGAGKTRLALELAWALQASYPGGVWWVDLAALPPGTAVLPAVAEALEVTDQSGRPALDAVIDYLLPRAVLLVLDNCEHVVEDCAALANRLLQACPQLTLLATSRETLGVAGEASWPVPPMSIDDESGQDLPEAVQLFQDRATLALPTFTLTAQNRSVISAICRLLDGLPLAIELAAARVKVLAAEQILERVQDRFNWLQSTDRAALPRHRTLAALVAWSYDLLQPVEQALLQGLSVFASTFTLEAVEAVVGNWLQPRSLEVVDLLARLVDKSLVEAEGQAGPIARYRLLETIRQFGQARLAEAGAAGALARRHLEYYTDCAIRAGVEMMGPKQNAWLARLPQEQDNMRAALRWAQSQGEVGLGLQMVAGLWLFWYIHGYWREGRIWLETFVALNQDGAEAGARAIALDGLGVLLWRLGDNDLAGQRLEQAVELSRRQGDQVTLARALVHMGILAGVLDDLPRARAAATESLALCRALNDQFGVARALHNLGNLAVYLGDYEEAQRAYDECLGLYQTWNDISGVALLTLGLATIAQEQRDLERARILFDESREMAREVGDTWNEAEAVSALGDVAYEKGELAAAVQHLEQSLRAFEQLGDVDGASRLKVMLGKALLAQGGLPRAAELIRTGLLGSQSLGSVAGVIKAIEAMAQVAVELDQWSLAARLLAAAARLHLETRVLLAGFKQDAMEALIARVKDQLGEAAFEQHWTAGATLSAEAAAAEALALSVPKPD